MSKNMNSERNKNSQLILNAISQRADRPVEFFEIYKNAKGTRFTGRGLDIAKSIWKIYKIKLPDNYVTLNKTLVMLDQRMTWPYYLSKKQLILFSEMDAFEFTLYQGDINLWANKE